MPGYKQTEAGLIPEDWEVKTVREVGAIKTGPFGTLLKASEYSAGDGVPLISVGEIREGSLTVTDRTPRVARAVVRRLPQYVLRKGDVVFGRKGAVERSAMIQEYEEGWFLGSDGLRLRPDAGCHDRFLALQLRSAGVQGWLRRNAIGTTMPSLNQEILGRAAISLPPTTAEQAAIAQALSDMDALIESLEHLTAKKRNIRQAALRELLRPKNGWARKRLADTATLKARIGWQGLTTAEYRDAGEFYLVTGTDFKDGFVDWSNCHYVDQSRYRQDTNIQLRSRDVLLTKDGTVGKVALIDGLDRPATLNSGVFVIRPVGDAFHPEFFYYLLCSDVFLVFLGQLSAGSTINHLYQKDLVGFTFEAPATLAEQIAIAATLADIDEELAALEAKLSKARQIKCGMMQELLTGRIRLV